MGVNRRVKRNIRGGGRRLDDGQQTTNNSQSFDFVQMLRMLLFLVVSYISPNFSIGYYSHRLSMYLLPNHCISNIVYAWVLVLSLSQSVLAMDGASSTTSALVGVAGAATGAAISLAHSFIGDASHNNADPNNKSQKKATSNSERSLFHILYRNTKLKRTNKKLISNSLTASQPRAIVENGRIVPVLRWDRVSGWNWTCAAFDKLPLPLQKMIENPNPPIRCFARGIDAPFPILLTAGCIFGTNYGRAGSLYVELGGGERGRFNNIPEEGSVIRGTWRIYKFYGSFEQWLRAQAEAFSNRELLIESLAAADKWTKENMANVATFAFLLFDINDGSGITDTTLPRKVFSCIDALWTAPPKGVGHYKDAQGKNHPQLTDFTEENNYTFDMKIRGHKVAIKAVPLDGDEHEKWKGCDSSEWDTLARQLAKKKRKKCPLCPYACSPNFVKRYLTTHFAEHGVGALDAWLEENDHDLEWV